MKITRDSAIRIAQNLMKELNTPYESVNASYVEGNQQPYWLVAFEGKPQDALADGNVSFVVVDAETGTANLRPHP